MFRVNFAIHLSNQPHRRPAGARRSSTQHNARLILTGAGDNPCHFPIIGVATFSPGTFLIDHDNPSKLELLRVCYVELLGAVLSC
jgi:hypothetical protein